MSKKNNNKKTKTDKPQTTSLEDFCNQISKHDSEYKYLLAPILTYYQEHNKIYNSMRHVRNHYSHYYHTYPANKPLPNVLQILNILSKKPIPQMLNVTLSKIVKEYHGYANNQTKRNREFTNVYNLLHPRKAEIKNLIVDRKTQKTQQYIFITFNNKKQKQKQNENKDNNYTLHHLVIPKNYIKALFTHNNKKNTLTFCFKYNDTTFYDINEFKKQIENNAKTNKINIPKRITIGKSFLQNTKEDTKQKKLFTINNTLDIDFTEDLNKTKIILQRPEQKNLDTLLENNEHIIDKNITITFENKEILIKWIKKNKKQLEPILKFAKKRGGGSILGTSIELFKDILQNYYYKNYTTTNIDNANLLEFNITKTDTDTDTTSTKNTTKLKELNKFINKQISRNYGNGSKFIKQLFLFEKEFFDNTKSDQDYVDFIYDNLKLNDNNTPKLKQYLPKIDLQDLMEQLKKLRNCALHFNQPRLLKDYLEVKKFVNYKKNKLNNKKIGTIDKLLQDLAIIIKDYTSKARIEEESKQKELRIEKESKQKELIKELENTQISPNI